MGYSENAKAYRVYILESKKVMVSGDVKFLEEKAFRNLERWPQIRSLRKIH